MPSRKKHPTAAVPSNLTVEEARAEIQSAAATLEAVLDRLQVVRESLRTPTDPIRDALEKAFFIPEREATMICGELKMFLQPDQGIPEAITCLHDSLAWDTRKKREALFIDSLGGDPKKTLSVAEAIEFGETEGKYYEAQAHLGLALQEIDPDEDQETFFNVLFYIETFKRMARQKRSRDWSIDPPSLIRYMTNPEKKQRWVLNNSIQSTESDLERLRILLAILASFRGFAGYVKLQRLEKSIAKELSALKGLVTV